MPREDDELVTAYVDGVGELSPEERRRAEAALAADPDARAEAEASRALLGTLRALPPEGTEPDWAALERRIRAAVAPIAPAPWWRRVRWLLPVGALATGAAAAVIWAAVGRAPAPQAAEIAPAQAAEVAPAPEVAPVPAARAAPQLVWLDDEAIDVGGLDPEAVLGDLDRDARAALSADSTDVTGGILPVEDLDWVDGLDDAQLDRAERWLSTPHHAEPDPRSGSNHGKNG